MPELAAIYTRISRDMKGERIGVENQRAECEKLAASKGFEVYRVYEDNDIGASAQTDKNKVRTEWLQMLDDVRAGKFRYVIAYSASRLTRKPSDLDELVSLARDPNIGLKYLTVVSGADDLLTADGLIMARVKNAFDAGESDRTSERVKLFNAKSALEGKKNRTKYRPFGWNEDQDTLRHDEADLIREAVRQILAGASISEIQDRWNKAKVPTTTGRTEWDWAGVKRVTLGWRVAGVRTHRDSRTGKDEPVKKADGSYVIGQWPAIITQDERERALAILERRSRRKVRTGSWLLSGLVICGECGGRMYGALKRGDFPSTYQCKPGSSHVAIHAAKLEEIVYSQLVFRLLDQRQADLEAGDAELPAQPKEWGGQERLTTVNERIAEGMRAWGDGLIDGSVIFAEIERLHEQRRALEKDRAAFAAEQARPVVEVTSADDTVAGVMQTLYGIDPVTGERHEPSFEAKRALLMSEVEVVRVAKGERGRASQSPSNFQRRIHINWRERRSGLRTVSGRAVTTTGDAVADDLTDEPVTARTMTPSEGEHS